MKDNSVCLNCEKEVEGKYCSNCGQKTKLTAITFTDIGKELVGTIANYDAPFPRTLGNLFYRPGKLVREYLSGKRRRYFAAVRYLVVCLALSIIIIKVFDYDPVEVQVSASDRKPDGNSSDMIKAGRFLHRNVNYFIFIFPFTIGLFTKIFFWRKKYSFAEHTTLGFYCAGQFLIINSIMIPLILYEVKLFKVLNYLVIFYLTFAFYSFFKPKNKWLGVPQAIFSATLSFISYIFLSFLVAFLVIRFL